MGSSGSEFAKVLNRLKAEGVQAEGRRGKGSKAEGRNSESDASKASLLGIVFPPSAYQPSALTSEPLQPIML